MQKPLAIIVGLLLVPLAAALSALVLMVLGAAAGWLGGLVFPQVFANMSQMLFGDAVPAWQIGAMFGFIGGFFRSIGSGRKAR